MNVAPMIQAIQAKTGWKQSQVAERLRVHQSQISRWLNGQKADWDAGNAIRDLAIDVGALTNEGGTSKLTYVVPLRWRIGVGGVVRENDDPSFTPMASLSIPVPTHCLGMEVLANGVTARGKSGDLLIVGPVTTEFDHLLGTEALVTLADGRHLFGTLVSSAVPGALGVVGAHGELHADVQAVSAAPYCATFAAGQWEEATAEG